MCSQHDFPIKLSNILSTVHLVKKCLHVKSGIEGVINLIFILMIVPSFHQGRIQNRSEMGGNYLGS